jgi:hypothetical protein
MVLQRNLHEKHQCRQFYTGTACDGTVPRNDTHRQRQEEESKLLRTSTRSMASQQRRVHSGGLMLGDIFGKVGLGVLVIECTT